MANPADHDCDSLPYPPFVYLSSESRSRVPIYAFLILSRGPTNRYIYLYSTHAFLITILTILYINLPSTLSSQSANRRRGLHHHHEWDVSRSGVGAGEERLRAREGAGLCRRRTRRPRLRAGSAPGDGLALLRRENQ